MFLASTDPSRDRVNGAAFVIPDDGEVFCVERDKMDVLSPEFYDLVRARVQSQAL